MNIGKIKENLNVNKKYDDNTSFETQTSNIEFMENSIGNKKNDVTEFNNQTNLIKNNATSYMEDLNYQNKLRKNRFENDEYNKNISDELRMSDYRINQPQTIIDGINISNPLIYPKTYDQYIEYLFKKSINPINTQVVLNNKIYNLDSSLLSLNSNHIKIPLNDNSFQFTNNSDILKINFDNINSILQPGDLISISGLSNNKIVINELQFNFKNNSSLVTIDLVPNYNFEISFISVYMNFNLSTKIQTFQNIPIQILNRTYKVTLFYDNTSTLKLSFNLPIKFYSRNIYDTIFTSKCTITLFNIGNYPTNMLNTDLNISQNTLFPYLTVEDSNSSSITIRLKGNISINNNFSTGTEFQGSFFTGSGVTLTKINPDDANKTNTSYIFHLGNNIENVCGIEITSSEIPNFNYNITSSNNKFYWNNIEDSFLYSIILDPGLYTYQKLADKMMTLISQVKRVGVNPLTQYDYNIMEISFDVESETSSFFSYNIFYLPKSLIKINEINDRVFNIQVSHPNHNLFEGDRIFITDSLDYKFISQTYINDIKGHLIVEVINNDIYVITIIDINKIEITSESLLNGGDSIKIKSPNSISLNFSENDTFGELIGFVQTGNQFSVTSFSSNTNNYIITNKQPYSFNIENSLIVNNLESPNRIFKINNYSYILLNTEGFNNKTQALTSSEYFYKFQLSSNNDSTYFNTFVNEPIVINPPIKKISSLKLSWQYPDGTTPDFQGKNFSLSIKISSIDNYPENTFITQNLSRI